jgi:hypothetical protein
MSIDFVEITDTTTPPPPAADPGTGEPPSAAGAAPRAPRASLDQRVSRWAFRNLLDARRRWRRMLRPLRREALLANPTVSQLAWEWYRFKFRFARVRLLRQVQFLVRDRVGGQRATVLSDKLLLGGWNGLSGYRFAVRSNLPLDPSTPLARSFYVELLADYDRDGEAALSDARIQASGYYKRIAAVAEITGHYRGQSEPAGLIEVAREYVDRYLGREVPYRPGRSRPGMLPRVRAVAHSDCYQVLDGHHRLAKSIHRGERSLEVVIAPGSTTTYLQRLLLDMSWLDGSRRLYQPVNHPEVGTWPLMRRCTDRLELIVDHLTARGAIEPGGRAFGRPGYLDVGSCYGWFVAELRRLGFDARGIEMDPLARELGPLIYGLDPAQIDIGDCIELLRDPARSADYVSCFSVLHHFVMGRGTASAQELMRLLDARTGKVLYLDTGQSHESWFRITLRDWTPEYIAAWIRANSSFTRVEAIGVDADGDGAFRGKFGRTLFACSRG